MVLAAEFGTGEVFFSILWFFLIGLAIWLVITIFRDIIQSPDLSGWGKALWAIAILVLPYLGVLIYLIVRGDAMADRTVHSPDEQARIRDAAMRSSQGSSGLGSSTVAQREARAMGRLR